MQTANNHIPPDNSLTTKILIACGAIGPILFILVFTIEGALRPDYSAWHNFVSDLSQSDQGWIQITNFLICGVCMLCFSLGLGRILHTGKGAFWGPIMLGIFGLSLLIAGIFVTDPSLGYYPAGTFITTHTLHGTIHGVNALPAFGSLAIAIFVLARSFTGNPAWRGWTLYSVLTGIIFLVSFIACLTVAVLDQNGILPGSPTGLLERIAIIVGWSWIAHLAIRLLIQLKHVPQGNTDK